MRSILHNPWIANQGAGTGMKQDKAVLTLALLLAPFFLPGIAAAQSAKPTADQDIQLSVFGAASGRLYRPLRRQEPQRHRRHRPRSRPLARDAPRTGSARHLSHGQGDHRRSERCPRWPQAGLPPGPSHSPLRRLSLRPRPDELVTVTPVTDGRDTETSSKQLLPGLHHLRLLPRRRLRLRPQQPLCHQDRWPIPAMGLPCQPPRESSIPPSDPSASSTASASSACPESQRTRRHPPGGRITG